MHPIINEYRKKGYITKEAAIRLQEFESITKEASFADTLKKVWGALKEIGSGALTSTAGPLVGTAAGIVTMDYLNNRELKKRDQNIQKKLDDSFEKMFSLLPKLKKYDKEKVNERFSDIARISPTLASTPQVVAKVVQRTMKKGLDEKDMFNLSQIESNATRIKSAPKPKSRWAPMARQTVAPIAQEMAERGMLHAGVTPLSKRRTPQDASDLSQFSRPFGEIIGTNQDILSRVPPEHKLNAMKQLIQDPQSSVERIRSAVKAGVPLPDHIKNLHSGNPKDIKALHSFLVSPEGGALFPEIHASSEETDKYKAEKKAHVLADMHILVKEAGLPQGFWTGLLAAGALGLGTGVAHIAADEISTRKRRREVSDSWNETQKNLKKMTSEGNELANNIDYSNPKTQAIAKNVFNTLVTVAPDLASNPSIATTYVNRLVGAGEIDVQAIKTVSEIQKNMDSVSGYSSPFAKNPLVRGFESGFQASGGEKLIGEVSKSLVSYPKKDNKDK